MPLPKVELTLLEFFFISYLYVKSNNHVSVILRLTYVQRKRKAVAPDTCATSSKKSSTLSLIEMKDMEDLIDDLMKTKVIF